jgi:hypothetical protein
LVTHYSKSSSFSGKFHQVIIAKPELLEWGIPKLEPGNQMVAVHLWLPNSSLVTQYSKGSSFSGKFHQVIIAKPELLEWEIFKREPGNQGKSVKIRPIRVIRVLST